MRARTAALLAAAIVCGATKIHAAESGIFRVAVHLHVARSIASRVTVPILEEEAESLWTPYGVQLEWADAGTAAPGLAVDAYIESAPLSAWVPILGRVAVGPDMHSGPIRVSFESTERVLASRAHTLVPFVRDRDMARALGRVLAHEIGHVLLAVPAHDSAGLMRATFLPADLGDPDRAPFRLAVNAVGRLRSRVRVLTRSE